MHPQLSKAKVRRCGLPSKAMLQEALLIRTSILEAQDREKSYNILEKVATTALNAL